jgi:GTP-binding protein
VGKSSLINAMANAKIAISSKTPGRTRLVNFFRFNSFRLIDLPGYGYANLGKEKKVDLVVLIENYLIKRVNLFGVFQIIDASVLTQDDITMANFLKSKFVNHFIIINKIDKVSKNVLNNNLNKISKILNVKKENIICASSSKNIGIKLIFNKINECLKNSK